MEKGKDKKATTGVHREGGQDHFACWYCVNYLDKVPGLKSFPG